MIDFGDVDLKALDAEARTALRGGNVDRGLELFERLWQVAWVVVRRTLGSTSRLSAVVLQNTS